MLWCWRCKSEMPMLDEEEFAEIAALQRKLLSPAKAHRAKTGAPPNGPSVKEQLMPCSGKV
jgi:hypothetical protein